MLFQTCLLRGCVTIVKRTLLTASITDHYITIIDSGISMKYPQIWLRDNCYCNQCFHKDTQSRIYKFRIDTNAINVVIPDELNVQIQWSDQHISNYSLSWLKEREFTTRNKNIYINEYYQPKYLLWGRAAFSNICKTFTYSEILHSENELRDWIDTVAAFGIAIIKHTPKREDAVRKLAEIVGFIRRTHYGEEFLVKAKSHAKNYAYLPRALPLHTDLPYYRYKPGLNMLHYLVQSHSSGGSSLLADGFYVAEQLKINNLENFNILKRTPVDWCDIGQEENGNKFHSIFREDDDGCYSRINVSIPQRDSQFTVPLKDVIPWYNAYWEFIGKLKKETVAFKLMEGDMLTFNNLRILHGRTAYNDTKNNMRYVVGAYLDWDIALAKWRYIKRR